MTEASAVGPHQELPGSERAAAPGAEYVGAVDPDEQVELTLVLRRRGELAESVVHAGVLTSAELAQSYGADPADVDRVRAVITSAGAEVLAVDLASRRIRVGGALSVWMQLFGAELTRVRSTDPTSGQPVEHRHRAGTLSVPDALAGVVVAVLGLDDRPQSRAHLRFATRTTRTTPAAPAGPAAAAAPTSYTPLQLATTYAMPADTDGTGQRIAIIELGGGFGAADLATYFGGLQLATPSVTAVSVDGANNEPDQDPSGADGEVLLDIEVAGAIAPKATILVYFAPNTDAGFLDAIATASHTSPAPTAMSISWGQSEDSWTAQARTSMDDAFADAAALGITVTAAAGDNGSGDGVSTSTKITKAHVDFPASSPHVLACGGTSLTVNQSTGAVTSETVWNDGTSGGATGGGVSDTFALPSWQAAVGVPARHRGGTGRGVPDVAGDADPETGYSVYIDGQTEVIGGTSAVAPLWAALVCRLAQSLGAPLGLLQPRIYQGAKKGQPTAGLRDITKGSNGAYKAGPGWDACTGLGVPDGTALLALLKASEDD
jgi:kumamolisin